jgi:hypothetical protein
MAAMNLSMKLFLKKNEIRNLKIKKSKTNKIKIKLNLITKPLSSPQQWRQKLM